MNTEEYKEIGDNLYIPLESIGVPRIVDRREDPSFVILCREGGDVLGRGLSGRRCPFENYLFYERCLNCKTVAYIGILILK